MAGNVPHKNVIRVELFRCKDVAPRFPVSDVTNRLYIFSLRATVMRSLILYLKVVRSKPIPFSC